MGGAFEYAVNDIDRRKQAEESKERAMVRLALGNFADRPARHGDARRARVACRERGVIGVDISAVWKQSMGAQKIQTRKVE